MERMSITVISCRVFDRHVRAVVRADGPPHVVIHLRLEFPITGPTDVWAAARDEALKYLDPA